MTLTKEAKAKKSRLQPLSFEGWLQNEFLNGGFITDFKKHAMKEAWMGGVMMGQEMSPCQIKAIRETIGVHKMSPKCW